MINKYAEIRDRIILYNACKGILRVKQAQMQKEAIDWSFLTKIPSAVGAVGRGISSAGKFIGNVGAPVVHGVNKALTSLSGLSGAAKGLATVGDMGKSITTIGATVGALPQTIKNFESGMSAFDDDDTEDTSSNNAATQAKPQQAGQSQQSASANPYPNDEGIDNSDLPPGLDMDDPELIMALLSAKRPITKRQRAIISKYIQQQQGAQGNAAAPAQQAAAPTQQVAGSNPAIYANTAANPAQGQM